MEILTYENKVIKLYLDFLKFILKFWLLILLLILSIIFGVIFGILVYWIEGFNYAINSQSKGIMLYVKLIVYSIAWSFASIFKGPYDLWMDSFNDLF